MTEPGHTNLLYYGDNLDILRRYIKDETIDLVYLDPPFNTGKVQTRTRIATIRDRDGDRVGFQGRRRLETGTDEPVCWPAVDRCILKGG